MKEFIFRKELNGVDAYTRHKKLVQDYARYYGKVNKPKEQSYNPEHDILRKHHRFIQTYDSEDKDELTWEERIAKKYYDQLFKEYALCDLSYYKHGKIALRWRTENEVMIGKGQFICASTRCDIMDKLTSWEVNFAYFEDNEKKNELVKVRLCKDCSYKLNYKTQKRIAKRENKKRSRQQQSDDDKDDFSDLIHDDYHSDHDGLNSEDNNNKNDTSSKSRKKRKTNNDDDDYKSKKEQEESNSSIWSKPLEEKDEKTLEEEFEDYFADLLQ
ncbi:unnamed protein product [Cunninghamella blakesleeana]